MASVSFAFDDEDDDDDFDDDDKIHGRDPDISLKNERYPLLASHTLEMLLSWGHGRLPKLQF